ncbi:MAG: hypothetical protein AB7F97_09135 [Solirubrobacterales bacterium]
MAVGVTLSAMADEKRAQQGTPSGRASGLKARVKYWLDSDLIGIVATLYAFVVLVLAFVVFRVGGGIAGMIVIVVSWVPMVLFAIRGWGKPPARLRMEIPPEGPRHRVLVIANQGLEDEALCDEVCRRTARTATEAMIVAPVVASSHLAELADDVDREMEVAQRRVEAALARLRGAGVIADGRADIAHPMDSLMDGLREYPPNEVVMLPDRETSWESAARMAERVRAEVGLPVTTIDASARASNASG